MTNQHNNDRIKDLFYIVAGIDKAVAFEWLANELPKINFRLTFILLQNEDSVLETFLQKEGIKCFRVNCSSMLQIPQAVAKVFLLLIRYRPVIVHCHLLHANLVGLIAGRLARIPIRIYTRHHSTFHHQYYPRAVLYDRLANAFSTKVIAISENVRQVLIEKEQVKPNKIALIHHGFKLDTYHTISPYRISAVKSRYRVKEDSYPVVGVVSRYFHLKGIQYIIPAFGQLLTKYPKAQLLLINAKGNYKKEISVQLDKLPKENYKEIIFEEDMSALYHCMDLYVHVPINPSIEAFGQTYIEALAAGVPSIFTLSGVATEFIRDKENALVVPYQNEEGIYHAMIRLLRDADMRKKLSAQGYQDVKEQFAFHRMIDKLVELYKG